MVEQAERNGGHYPAALAYLPPAPTPASALSAEQIADLMLDKYASSFGASIASSHTEERELSPTMVARSMLMAAVHMAREGMVFPPF